MSLDANEIFFPYNIVALMETAIADIDDDIQVFRRPLVVEDPDLAVSVFPVEWSFDQGSKEIAGNFIAEPVSQLYTIHIQGLVKDYDWTKGLKRHSQLARALRVLLYRNKPLQLALRNQSVTDPYGSTERFQDLDILGQEFYSNSKNDFIFLTTLRYQVKTEVVSS